MKPFNYFAPQDLDSCYEIVDKLGKSAYFMAGGTDLLVRIKTGRISPNEIVDIKNIKEIRSRIERNEEWIEVGALTLISEIQHNSLIEKYFPALKEAAGSVGSIQIRNRATIGGNLCNASPAADTVPALLIYNAKIKLVSTGGSRVIPLDQFLLGPGKTALQPGELLQTIILPLPTLRQAESYERLSRRRGVDLAIVNICAQVIASGKVRVAVGAAGPVAFVVEDQSGILINPDTEEEVKNEKLVELMQIASPISDIRASKEYRQAMLAVLAKRALQRASSQLNSKKEL